MPDTPPGLLELGALVHDCALAGVARRVLLLRADLLPRHLAHHLRLAQDALEPLTAADRARRHDLPHGRLAISWRGEAAPQLQAALDALRHLLLDAPPGIPDLPELTRLFDLPKDGVALLALAASPAHGALPRPPPPPGTKPPRPSRPLDLATLDTVETRLATANVARFTRRRHVCHTPGAGAAPTLAWDSRFLSAQDLAAELSPGHDIHADPWLFRRLTRTMDRRMLTHLAAPAELRDAGPFSLDLNIGGILSPEFLRFDAALPPRLRGHTVLALHPADILADIPAFRFAAAFARARGHRLLLRALVPALLPVLDLPALALDYIELRWTQAVAGLDLAALVAGPATWLLSRADETGLRWARAAGLPLVQGDIIRPGLPTPA